MAKETLKLKITQEEGINHILRHLVDNNYKVWRSKEKGKPVGSVEMFDYFINAEKVN